ncbi:MAG TPA: neutral/alkaline non-lysosomal ceramidase N-terminal domain-containing protein, partial [Acidimicrobiales bacterium]|nr:neutral/alkaline non-lysosomal ceramidase N-terminal domain-containing protein [Acidimicrobiales bacterium]
MPPDSSRPYESPLLQCADAGPGRMSLELGPVPRRELPHVAGLLAGAAVADITPPPGMPKAGYSANAVDGRGFRTRLRARVVHLRSGETSLALVACDLLGGSAILQHLIARTVAEWTDVPIEGLLIGATHTHAGPGQFLGTDFYNRYASNRAGFDAAYSQFLVEEISAGVIRAFDSRRPAVLATGSADVYGLTRNRSLAAHLENASVASEPCGADRKFSAVNPRLHLLRVDSDRDGQGYAPLAALAVFSVHGTGISVR